MHRYLARSHAHTIARLTWGQTAGGTIANSLIGRGHTVTKAGPNGGADVLCLRIDHRVGPLHRETACPGGTQGGPNCLTHAPPALSDAEEEADGNGYIRDGRAEGSLGPPPVLASVNLVPLLWTGVPTPSTPVDRQAPLPIFRCPGNAFVLRSGLP